MSTHYLVDPFAAEQGILDVSSPESGTTDSTGALVIRVPDGVAIHGGPSNLTALLDAKAVGLLASFAGFTHIVHDDCLTPGQVASTSTGILRGSGVVNHCILKTGSLVTVSVPLATTPTVCIVVWEAYTFINDDPAAGRFTRVYVEEEADLLSCHVAFASHPTNATTSGAILNVPPANQGNSVVLTFSNSSVPRVYLGGWAVIY